MNTWRIVVGDALERLRELDAGSVQTCVTSPPYFGLRCYGNDRQLGLEATPDEYVARLVEVFREVRRVLRDDGTLWLNLGDTYSADHSQRGLQPDKKNVGGGSSRRAPAPGCKPKDLLGIPWMVAFALRADGWYLRSDIVWAKPNPMPESVTDRPTKAHEYVFLLSKSPRYFYDADGIREDAETFGRQGSEREDTGAKNGSIDTRWHKAPLDRYDIPGRNKRSVWTVATVPFPGAHFAVFPPKLIEPCVLAGSAEDACGVCGAPWERVVEREDLTDRERTRNVGGRTDGLTRGSGPGEGFYAEHHTLGWRPSCTHTGYTVSGAAEHENKLAAQTRARAEDMKAIPHPTEVGAWQVVPTPTSSTVLDPFAGAGTTGLVATRLGRSFIGIELNPEYAELARDRIRDDAPLMNYLIEAS